MKRNTVLIFLLVVIGGVAFYVWKTKKDPSTNMERAESNFKVEDINSIYRVLITDKQGLRSDLKRVDDHWIINDRHRVRKTNIEFLLRGIQRQHLEHIPTKAASENIIASMAVNAIHVEIFDKAGEKILGYYVGGVTPDERGTFFLKEGSSQPYSLSEPGFDGGLRARYALRPVDWRDVRFWIEDTERIDTFRVHYPKQKQHSFILYKNGNEYNLDPMFATTERKEGLNQNKVNSYLTSLNQLACETFLNDSPEKDSILQMVPFLEINMIYPSDTTYLRFFPSGQFKESQYSTDIPRYFIDYSGRDFMIGQHDVLKGAFRSYEFFFE